MGGRSCFITSGSFGHGLLCNVVSVSAMPCIKVCSSWRKCVVQSTRNQVWEDIFLISGVSSEVLRCWTFLVSSIMINITGV